MITYIIDRIGHTAIEELMWHGWFSDFDWDKLESKTLSKNLILSYIAPPYIPPEEKENFNQTLINRPDKWLLENKTILEESKKKLKHNFVQDQFKGFNFTPLYETTSI